MSYTIYCLLHLHGLLNYENAHYTPFYNYLPKLNPNLHLSPIIMIIHTCRELTRNSQPVRNKKKKKKQRKHTPKKNNHMHKTIFTWFGNLPTSTKLQRFYYYQEKNTKCSYSVSVSQNMTTTTNKTLITKNSFYILRTGFTMVFTSGLDPLLHRLSLSKSLIKNHATLFGSGQVVNQIKYNQAPQSSTNLPLGDQFNHRHQPQSSKT